MRRVGVRGRRGEEGAVRATYFVTSLSKGASRRGGSRRGGTGWRRRGNLRASHGGRLQGGVQPAWVAPGVREGAATSSRPAGTWVGVGRWA